MNAQDEMFNQLQHTGFDFLITDLEIGLTLCSIARDAGEDLEKRNRNQQNARRAYDTVLRFTAKRSFTEDESQELNDKVRQLRTELANLGEVFGTAA